MHALKNLVLQHSTLIGTGNDDPGIFVLLSMEKVSHELAQILQLARRRVAET